MVFSSARRNGFESGDRRSRETERLAFHGVSVFSRRRLRADGTGGNRAEFGENYPLSPPVGAF